MYGRTGARERVNGVCERESVCVRVRGRKGQGEMSRAKQKARRDCSFVRPIGQGDGGRSRRAIISAEYGDGGAAFLKRRRGGRWMGMGKEKKTPIAGPEYGRMERASSCRTAAASDPVC